jgi:hypothetical protein
MPELVQELPRRPNMEAAMAASSVPAEDLLIEPPGKRARPKGVAAVSILHFVAGLGLALLATVSFASEEESTLTSASAAVLAGLILLGGYGLWRKKAWAWWLVFVNSAGEASTLTLLLAVEALQGRNMTTDDLSYVAFVASTAGVAVYLWSTPIRSAFTGQPVTRRETPPQTVRGAALVALSIAGFIGFAVGLASGEQLTISVESAGGEHLSFTGEIRAYDLSALGPSKKKQSISGTTPATFKFRAPEGYIVFVLVDSVCSEVNFKMSI